MASFGYQLMVEAGRNTTLTDDYETIQAYEMFSNMVNDLKHGTTLQELINGLNRVYENMDIFAKTEKTAINNMLEYTQKLFETL